MIEVSVILCTHQPDRRLLDRVLKAVASQRGAPTREVIIVDNRSEPALEDDVVKASGVSPARLVKEPVQGLAFARARGIESARGRLFVFVDDDNILSTNYLSEASRAASENSKIGVFAGRAHGLFERQPDWLVRQHIARYAVRDLGDDPLIGSGEHWGPHEPFGAGLCVRANIARVFADLVRASGDAGGLGRTGRELASGEDSLFSRIADALGYQVGYIPSLRLDHHIKADRLSWRYLFRLIAGQARAHVIMDRICGRPDPVAPPPVWREPDMSLRRFLGRLRSPGLYEAITHIAWDHAYWREQRRNPSSGEIILARGLKALREFDLPATPTSEKPLT
ncbi:MULTISPECIES: glycosyltransferase [Hyphobacterium]|uniref:Glycosyltransferase n=1 Tax=Hyphobacterium vulgare TaxID=1736751 RepID=A0ABV6ZVF0_9PROT